MRGFYNTPVNRICEIMGEQWALLNGTHHNKYCTRSG
jgi:hypothetical protein